MMYKKDKRLAFVLVPKCGSTTLRHILNWNGFKVLTGFEKSSTADFYHVSYQECVRKYPNLRSYRTYGVFRNPLDRFVSAMNYAITRNIPLQKGLPFFRPQVEWLDAQSVSVINFENFEQSIKDIMESSVEVPHLNKSVKSGSYEVTDEVIAFVRDKYAADYQFAKDVLGKEY